MVLRKIYNTCTDKEIGKFEVFLLTESIKSNLALGAMLSELLEAFRNKNELKIQEILSVSNKEFRVTKIRLFNAHEIYKKHHQKIDINEARFNNELQENVFNSGRLKTEKLEKKELARVKSELKSLFVNFIVETLQRDKNEIEINIKFLKKKNGIYKKEIDNAKYEERENLKKRIKDIPEQIKLLRNQLDIQENLKLLEFYKDRQLKTTYENLYNRVGISSFFKDKRYNAANLFTEKYFGKSFFLYMLKIEKIHHDYVERYLDDGTGDIQLKTVNYLLDVVNLVDKLSTLCRVLSRKRITIIDNLTDEINQLISIDNYNEVPLIKLWFTAYQLLVSVQNVENITQDAEKAYNNLHELIDQNFHSIKIINSIKPKYLFEFYQILINTAKHFFENTRLWEQLHLLYKNLFDHLNSRSLTKQPNLENSNIIYIGNSIYVRPRVFNNIFTIMQALQKHKSKKFKISDLDIEKFFKVNNSFSEEFPNTYNYCYAQYHFDRKKFDEAQVIIKKIEVVNKFLEFDKRRFKLKLAYELNNNMLTPLIEKFTSYLNYTGDKITNEFISQNRMFKNFVNNLYVLKCDPNRTNKKVMNLRAKIEASNSPDKTWLLSKCDELII